MTTKTEYLQNLAEKFPERDRRGYVVGYYVYSGYGAAQKRETGAFPTAAEAQEWAEKVHEGHVLCGHVFTAKGKIVHAPPGDQPDTARTCSYCGAAIEHVPDVGWVEIAVGGHYDHCPSNWTEDDLQGPGHRPKEAR